MGVHVAGLLGPSLPASHVSHLQSRPHPAMIPPSAWHETPVIPKRPENLTVSSALSGAFPGLEKEIQSPIGPAGSFPSLQPSSALLSFLLSLSTQPAAGPSLPALLTHSFCLHALCLSIREPPTRNQIPMAALPAPPRHTALCWGLTHQVDRVGPVVVTP